MLVLLILVIDWKPLSRFEVFPLGILGSLVADFMQEGMVFARTLCMISQGLGEWVQIIDNFEKLVYYYLAKKRKRGRDTQYSPQKTNKSNQLRFFHKI